jgi:hypothetical protein
MDEENDEKKEEEKEKGQGEEENKEEEQENDGDNENEKEKEYYVLREKYPGILAVNFDIAQKAGFLSSKGAICRIGGGIKRII